MKKKILTIEILINEAKYFCIKESKYKNKSLYGVTDGKAVGTYVEHKFIENLRLSYDFILGSSSNGIDLPGDDMKTDIKVTSVKQPQSSCPFKNAKQKIFGLGYNILLFVYNKIDEPKGQFSVLDFMDCSYIDKSKTSDYTMTSMINEMLKIRPNKEDIIAFLSDKNLPADDITLNEIADEVLINPPVTGYLTISNALQWRLQYQRIVNLKSDIEGITKIISKE
jgi:hypothetical protein